MTSNERCTWSDLKVDECNHCHPEPRTRQNPDRPTRERDLRVVFPVAFQEPNPDSSPIDIGTDDTRQMTLQDYVTELCEATTRTERFTILQHNNDGTITPVTGRHRTTSVPLLEQLASAAERSGSVESGRRAFGSKPSASIEALDALQDVERDTYWWLAKLGVTDPHDQYPDLRDAVRQVRAKAMSSGELHKVERSVRSWWAQARVLTGWDSPSWRPANTCPLCAVKGGLRVRRDASAAVCVECRETWTGETIGLLAEHIRAENGESLESRLGLKHA